MTWRVNGRITVRCFRGTCWLEHTPQASLVHVVSRFRAMPSIPFGWAVDVSIHDAYVRIGPAWVILPRRWWLAARWHFCLWALRRGLAEEPYEGCYFAELIWFPAQQWR